MRIRSLFIAASSVLLFGCGSETSEPVITGPTVECTAAAAGFASGPTAFTTTTSGLKYRDVTVGTGAQLSSGITVGLRYAGCLTNGTVFDSNNSPKALLTFRLGTGAVIKGFDEGVTGMRVGGVREIVIPPSLGYGASAAGSIPANSTLVFTIAPVIAQ